MLSTQGYQVKKAVSGRFALQSLEVIKPDLILLDINMPDMDGYEVCQVLKDKCQVHNFADIPVIFISALGETLDKVKAFAVGGVDYVAKPFQVEEVIARVENHLKLQAAKLEIQKLNEDLEERVKERTKESFGEPFGAATGVSDPISRKNQPWPSALLHLIPPLRLLRGLCRW